MEQGTEQPCPLLLPLVLQFMKREQDYGGSSGFYLSVCVSLHERIGEYSVSVYA